MPNRGVMLCGHGSRDSRAVAEFADLAERLQDHLGPSWPLTHGFLEFAQPVLREGLEHLRRRGVDEILAVPGMLFAAGHAKNDIPSVLNSYAAERGNVTVRYGRELGVDPRLLSAAEARIAAAEAELDARDGAVAREDTCLVVIGRGASDPDANADAAKVARMLWEGMGFGWCEIGYSGVTFPLVTPALEHAARLGYKRLIVFPYFLFTGVLVERVYSLAHEVAQRFGVPMGMAGYLGAHEQVVAAFAERVQETLEGRAVMNCQVCKYRTQILRFTDDVGRPQESHHHHVEGAGTDAAGGHHHHHHDHGHDHRDHRHGHGHGHAHDHSHGHHHPPYPGADHPLGPQGYPGDVRRKRQGS